MLRKLSSAVMATVFALGGGIAVGVPGVAADPAAPWDPFFAPQATIADFGGATRPFGVSAGDYDGDTKVDLVVGRTTGNVAFVKGNGDGTFAAPTVYAWKQAFFNAWSFGTGDVNGDGNLDVVWGASATSSGCSISPIPTGQTCASIGGTTVTVSDGDVRAWLGNGNGTFTENAYFISGVRHNAGTLLARPATAAIDAGSLTVGDIDADGDKDIVVGATDGANSIVKILRNAAGTFSVEPLISQATACATPCSPIYFPAITTQNSPWGLSVSDADNDGDLDLWVGDRAIYTYLYLNSGSGAFTLQQANSAVSGRPNVYLGHDTFRAAVGFTGSLGSGDINGDGRADIAMGLHSGTQTPGSATTNDGVVLLDVSGGGGHTGFGPVADVGAMARGVIVIDVNGDGYRDIIAAEYDGKIKLLRQLAPVDTDGDGVSDYVDNAPNDANAPRLDMNTDASVNSRDQLDNDFDTVLGNPENPATWQRLGDPADPDDDNDGVLDASDNCPFTPNGSQADVDAATGADTFGDACDPLDDRDSDGDGIANGPLPGSPLYELALAAKAKWAEGDTHFVIRVDALGRFFQNEFTQIMTDAATLSPAAWAAKCWENYGPGGGDPADPCGTGEGTVDETLTLPGGKEVPVTLVTIPKQLWTDSPVVDWINDRNDNPLFELAQHGTYHVNNIPNSDWAALADRNFYSCEPCGLSEAEVYELMKVGYDTLLGNYANKWVAESGATAGSPKIDWSSSANPLISYSPPFNTSDTVAREAIAQLGFKAFSASIFEESGSYSLIFSPEGSHHEQFDQYGMFHASADLELDPPDTTGDTYNIANYEAYLRASTDDGGLTTWLIEEVEWSGRPCQNDDRLGTCNGGSNREDNTVYLPRWNAWMQVLDFVKNYPGGVSMTMGQVALAKAFDNAPTVANPDQADSDHDGVGDVIEGAALVAADANLGRNVAGTLSATLTNGTAQPLAGQTVTFTFDADGDATDEEYTGTTDASGVAQVTVTATRPTGAASFSVAWDSLRGGTANDSGDVDVTDAALLELDVGNPASGQVTDQVTVGATLVDSDSDPIEGRSLTFSIGSATGSGVTDALGYAFATLTLAGPAAVGTLEVVFAGDSPYSSATDSAAFTVAKEDTTLALVDAVGTKKIRAVAVAILSEADGTRLAGMSIDFYVQNNVRNVLTWVRVGGATTNATGVASFEIPAKYVSTVKRPIRATFAGDTSFLTSSGDAFAYRQ